MLTLLKDKKSPRPKAQVKAFIDMGCFALFSNSMPPERKSIIGQLQLYNSFQVFDFKEEQYKETILLSSPLLGMGRRKREKVR